MWQCNKWEKRAEGLGGRWGKDRAEMRMRHSVNCLCVSRDLQMLGTGHCEREGGGAVAE